MKIDITWRERVIGIVQRDGVAITDAIYYPEVAHVARDRAQAKIGRSCQGDDDSDWYKAVDEVAAEMAREVVARRVAIQAAGR
ncbi:MAG: hypothetical protein KC441_00540 [Anaerolineales bacterium]|nr:hypothetical protein [Anaerolineales bacterium]